MYIRSAHIPGAYRVVKTDEGPIDEQVIRTLLHQADARLMLRERRGNISEVLREAAKSLPCRGTGVH